MGDARKEGLGVQLSQKEGDVCSAARRAEVARLGSWGKRFRELRHASEQGVSSHLQHSGLCGLICTPIHTATNTRTVALTHTQTHTHEHSMHMPSTCRPPFAL